MRIRLEVNGRPVEAEVAPRTHLADFLREHLMLTGTHLGCEHGVCGACTVEIEGEIARSCITLAAACDGARVRTIEGFDDDPLMVRLRRAFSEEHALQCGYCTPGMLIAARDLVRRTARLDRHRIRVEMSGNLCRCTGYMGIVNAIERVAAERQSLALPEPASSTWLGPPPGPAGGAPAAAAAPRPAAAKAASADRPVLGPPPSLARAPIAVTVGAPREADGRTLLAQSFHLPHPREVVWQLMKDPAAVAACLPGAALEAPAENGRVKGTMSVRLGPIAASFAGEATVARMDADWRQVIEGAGGDRTSGSRVAGRIDYRLAEESGPGGRAGTRVDVEIAYAVTGALARFGRPGLVRDLVARIGETFATNLDRRLASPGTAPARMAELGGLSLVLAVLVARAKAFLARLLALRR